jgi:branched-chain amino acid aminotransferase
MQIYLDGQFVSREDAKVSVFDHGLLYGDGVFEGIRIYHTTVFRLEAHLKRLYRSAKYIALDIGKTLDEMSEIVLETCRRNGISDGYIRLVVTRGVGTLGLRPASCKQPTIFCIVDKLAIYPPEFYEKGLALLTVSTRRNRVDALDPQLKTLNYLNQILATIEAERSGFEEALMLNSEGYVAEAAADNLFIVRGNRLITPATHVGALPGITRAVALELADKFGMETQEAQITLQEVYNADECFLTGTAAEVCPVVEVDSRPIGDGKPGPTTQRLMEAFRDLTQSEGTAF